ncbi:MAG: hypothetical protein ACTSYI_05175 [Promethearchaeota archaeon]
MNKKNEILSEITQLPINKNKNEKPLEGLDLRIAESDSHFLEGYNRFKTRFLFRWAFFNGFIIGIFALGLYLYDFIGESIPEIDKFAGLLIGGFAILGIEMYILNRPFIKLNRALKLNPPQEIPTTNQDPLFNEGFSPNRHYLFDASPTITVTSCLIGLLILTPTSDSGGTTLGTISGIILVIGIILVNIWISPYMLLKVIKKNALQVNYEFK